MNSLTEGTEATEAIHWKCMYCGQNQFSCDSLEWDKDSDDLRIDNILCDNCGKDNLVYLKYK